MDFNSTTNQHLAKIIGSHLATLGTMEYAPHGGLHIWLTDGRFVVIDAFDGGWEVNVFADDDQEEAEDGLVSNHADLVGSVFFLLGLDSEMDSRVALAKDEITEGIREGVIPADVSCFAELHDHIDANELGGLTDEDCTFDIEQADAMQGMVDTWLKAGGHRG